MINLIKKFLKNITILSNGDKMEKYFCLFNTNYSVPLFALYPTKEQSFYNTKINKKLNWRFTKNDKENVNRCNSFRTDQSCYDRK